METATLLDVVVLDLETASSASDCRYCLLPEATHHALLTGVCVAQHGEMGSPATTYEPLGWGSKPALGLSLGAYFSYRDGGMHWFDRPTLHKTMATLVAQQVRLVSFNGVEFDFPLMRGLLRMEAQQLRDQGEWGQAEVLVGLCDAFKVLCERGYDILREIWRADPESKRVRGINSLDALAKANALQPKASLGADMPALWRAGHVATVAQHCQDDVLLTRDLFDWLCDTPSLARLDFRPVHLPSPFGIRKA